MMHDGDRRSSPLPEEYSRVTNPERFRPLHSVALALIDRLAADYDVTRAETIALLPDSPPFEYTRASVTLTPALPTAAPVAIAFTTFPGLNVRSGKWHATPFPCCGCDACRETVSSEQEHLERLLSDVVAGRFREEISIPLFGQAEVRFSLGDIAAGGDHLREGGVVLSRDRARKLLGKGPRRVQWQPWAHRETRR